MFFTIIIIVNNSFSQDRITTLDLKLSVVDLPFNSTVSYHYPSMKQSVELSNDMYDLTFWGIYSLVNINSKNKAPTLVRKKITNAVNYALDLAFVKYGSELPIPYGIWAHEEFHRSVLGVNNINAKNGNWIFERWDGTVFGVSDEQLSYLKSNNISNLLYSYVAGVQSENLSTKTNFINDFVTNRTFYKNALYLYNAYYVWNYFRFSTSSFTDSVKIYAPEFESKNPVERDFVGADLTAWVYDMYNYQHPYTEREWFPNGEGVNRRIAFSELPANGQEFLKKQKKLSLINFINPAIFFVNRIKPNYKISLNIFAQYNPTHFGNNIVTYVLFKKNKAVKFYSFVGFHNYNNQQKHFFGLELGVLDYKFEKLNKFEANCILNIWQQPENQNFYDENGKSGGSVDLKFDYKIKNNFEIFTCFKYKTKGWEIGNPYLDEKFQLNVGINYKLFLKVYVI